MKRERKQKFDNQAVQKAERVAKAKGKVTELVNKGHRLNADAASGHYARSVIKASVSPADRSIARRALEKKAMTGKYK